MTEEIHKIVITGDPTSGERAFRALKKGADALKKELDSSAQSTKELSGAMRDIARIDAFGEMKRGVAAAKAELASAQAKVAEIARAMKSAGGSSSELSGKFLEARRAVQVAKEAVQEKSLALQKLRADLQASGVNTAKLASEQLRLRGALKATAREALIASNNSDLLARRQAFYAQASLGASRLKREISGVGDASLLTGERFKTLVRSGGALLGIGLGANLIRDTSQLADEWTLVDARVRGATKSQAAYLAASDALLEIAKQTNSEFVSVATLFARTNKFIEANGGSQRDTLKLVELVSQAAKVSGAGVQEQQASVRQLAQALGSGVLRGDEFNSVLENSQRLAQALADGLNVPIGALRDMAEQGLLTADVVTDALLGQADKIAAEFAQIPITGGAAFTYLKTSVGDYVDDANKATGATQALASGIKGLADNIPGLAETFKQLIAFGLPAYMIRLALSVDLAAVAFSKLILPAAAIFGAAKVLELLTAINTERLRQQQLQNNGAAERAQLVATEHLLDVQVQSLAQYKEMSATAQEFYVKDLNQALEVARLKLKVNAGTNEQLAREGARQARIYSEALAEIAKADGNRAQAMKQHSNNVVVAKEMELARLNAVFKAQKQGLKEAEQAFEDARKKRAEVVKEFSDLRDEIGAKPQGEILGFELERAVEDARKAQEAAAKAPAAEAGKLADAALEKARAAGELLKAYKEQENAIGSSIDSAASETLTKQLADRLAGIADAAAGVQEQIAADQLATLQKSIQDTLNQAEALKDLSVSFDQEGAIKSLDEIMALIREKAQASPINIPVQIVTGSLPESVNEPVNTGVTDSQGRIVYRAGGGMVYGPGGPTDDKIHAMLSNREYVLRAAAVKRYGVRYLDDLNNLRLPVHKFANGGAVSRAAIPSLPSISASHGSSGTHRGTFTFPFGSYELQGAPDVFDSLTQASLQLRRRRA